MTNEVKPMSAELLAKISADNDTWSDGYKAADSNSLIAQRHALLTEVHRLRSIAPADAWQPIESAPKNYTAVMLFDPVGAVGEGWYSSHLHGWEFANSQHVMRRNPTHWQALPAPKLRSAP